MVDDFLDRRGLTLGEIDGFVCHPGGAKVLDALEQAFDIAPRSLTHARQVLREHGNMSAATVMFVLKSALDAGTRGRQLLTTLGPGFTAGLLILDVA
ncbi:MAG TPA: 3-oxoacyl-[acyl-carrier-protein] synthase III C-terminal domain-containing protein [Caulobacteraceae bacterium]|nr:3-oxoacyl-[acyl-carrier-protein] synthase III C-terminal domain-containing protein [Caulobacteraceae bacterium]